MIWNEFRIIIICLNHGLKQVGPLLQEEEEEDNKDKEKCKIIMTMIIRN